MSLNIEIKTIPQSEQRYVTVGDYWTEGDKEVFRITDCGNRKYEWMIAIHELIEKCLNEHLDITNKQVDEFDMNWKEEEGTECGDEPTCPYRESHCFATAAERMLCAAMGLSWAEYEEFLEKL